MPASIVCGSTAVPAMESATATAWNASGSREAGVAGGRAIDPVVTVSVQIAARKASDTARRAVRRPRPRRVGGRSTVPGGMCSASIAGSSDLPSQRSGNSSARVIRRAWIQVEEREGGTTCGGTAVSANARSRIGLEPWQVAWVDLPVRPSIQGRSRNQGTRDVWTRSGSWPATRRPGRRPCRRRWAPAG